MMIRIRYTRNTLAEIEFVDIVVGVMLLIASLRGLSLGLVREAFSLIGIAAAYLAVRFFVLPIGDGLIELTGGRISANIAPWIAGALLVVLTIAVVTRVGRTIRRGVHAVGLGFIDRMGGMQLGAAEGMLMVALLFTLTERFLGRDHPTLTDTYTLEALEQLELVFHAAPAVDFDVASPPRSR